MGADEDGTAKCFPTFAKVSALMTDDGAPAAVINGNYQPMIEDMWFRCSATRDRVHVLGERCL
jgi:hypothetical protein